MKRECNKRGAHTEAKTEVKKRDKAEAEKASRQPEEKGVEM